MNSVADNTQRAKLTSLSFVFPMYNELGNIERSVDGALCVGRQMADDVEIVIVDDASTDGSGRLADGLAAKHPEVKVFHHEKNRKLGGAMKTGFRNASKDWVLYVDSDMPIKLEESLRAVPPALHGNDLVIGWRRNRNEGIKREILSFVYNRIIRYTFGLNVIDVNFAFKMMRREVLQSVPLYSEGSFIDAELLIEAKRQGFRIAEIGLDYYPRTAGVSTLASNSVIFKIISEMSAYRRNRRTTPIRGGEPRIAVSKTTHRQR
jgi:glycosyltransferase involved in cell wall biosynthesis